jgi:hypothetical protein
VTAVARDSHLNITAEKKSVKMFDQMTIIELAEFFSPI